jgi:MOSC domain-containing protein YiiM
MEGILEYIAVRPAAKADVAIKEEAILLTAAGIEGDHYGKSGEREVTLIQAEHLEEVGRVLGKPIEKGITRRNLVVRGLNLREYKNQSIKIGDVILEVTGDCHPCSRMDLVLGPGGLKAMAGRGGITARVIQGGTVRTGDPITPL